MSSNFQKEMAKSVAMFYAGHSLRKVSKNIKQYRSTMNAGYSEDEINYYKMREHEFSFDENNLLKTMSTISGMLEMSFKSGVQLPPYLVENAREMLNKFQLLLDYKQKYINSMKGK